ncbi:hypothetical protein HKX48_000439 [Thoreauomyces humboldtii]|nr:hypothetical protein HKX48_000439 [Thoreauomyces humboldtii]
MGLGTPVVVNAGTGRPQPSARAAIGGASPRRPSLLRAASLFSVASLRRVPVGVKTRMDFRRLFFYLSLFLVPYILSLVTFLGMPVFQAPSVASARTDPGRLEWTFNYFNYCYRMVDDGSGSGSTDPLVGYPSTQQCQSYVTLCAGTGSTRFWTKFDPAPGIPDRTAFCGVGFRTAVALEIAAAVSGAIAILSFIDNALVWANVSLWYHPARHRTAQVRTVRRAFRDVILLAVAGHMVFQCAAFSMLYKIQNGGSVRWPSSLQMHYGLWLSGLSWLGDFLFLVLFLFFDRLTFFAVPVYEDGVEATGSVASQYLRMNKV